MLYPRITSAADTVSRGLHEECQPIAVDRCLLPWGQFDASRNILGRPWEGSVCRDPRVRRPAAGSGEEAMRCPGCDRDNPPGSAFCGFCGRPMPQSLTPVTAARPGNESVLAQQQWAPRTATNHFAVPEDGRRGHRSDDAATRYLCAAVALSPTVRQSALDGVLEEEHRAVVTTPGVDLVTGVEVRTGGTSPTDNTRHCPPGTALRADRMALRPPLGHRIPAIARSRLGDRVH